MNVENIWVHKSVYLLFVFTSGLLEHGFAISPKDAAVEVHATVSSSPPSITLTWVEDATHTATNYFVSRMRDGEQDWQRIATLHGTSTSFTDAEVTAGVRYEYEILKASSTHTGVGYLYTGIEIPATESRGTILLIAHSMVSESLAFQLERLESDLVGDGWVVIREHVHREDTVETVHSLIQSHYLAHPEKVRALFLFGHVPVPYSGFIVPDGHNPDHLGAWPADARYGNQGVWTDNRKKTIAPADTRNQNIPGDGKYDQTTLPGTMVLHVGRVDLSNLPSSELSESELLRQYLDKNHAYRHGKERFSTQGILYDGFGSYGGETLAANGWRNFAPLVGNSTLQVTASGFLPALQSSRFIFGYACGSGTYTSLAGVGTTKEVLDGNCSPVFSMLFGSYFGDWDTTDNFLRASLATKEGGLASCWAGRPSWYFHHMALGEPIGYSARITQGNAGRYKLPGYGSQMVHAALMGDPTLRLHVISPPSKLTGRVRRGTVILSWEQSADAVDGYNIYRLNGSGTYTRLNSKPVLETVFEDDTARTSGLAHTYMVRAEKLETRGSGSYHNLSQGIFRKISLSNLKTRRRF